MANEIAQVFKTISVLCAGDLTPTVHHKLPPALEPSSFTLPEPFVACITGASRNIGKATAEVFAKAGASGLILTARKVESLEATRKSCEALAQSSNLKISLVALETGDEAATKRLTDVIKTEHRRLDFLINNAGFVSTHESAFAEFEDIRPDQFSATMDCHYIGRILTMQNLIPLLLSSPNGTKMIVNLSSVAGHLTHMGAMGFCMSTLASNRLIEIVAARYADQGLLCYAIHPGAVAPEDKQLPPGMPADMLKFSQDEPSLLGGFCLWLIQKRPEWLSGRYLNAFWDTAELEAKRDEIVEGDKLKFRMVV